MYGLPTAILSAERKTGDSGEMPATRPAAIAATDSSERATPDHRLTRLAHEVVRATDPEAALRTLRLLQDELALVERDCVAAALGDGSSFRSVADALGISRQAAHRRYRDLAPSVVRDESPALSSHARRALYLAREEATGMGAGALRSEHVLLGVLRSGGGVSRAMDAEGLSADAVRQCLPDGGAGTSAPGAADAARAVLAEAE